MPKELFNQPLITTPTQPDDNDRIALSTPGATGGKNILWSYFKQLLQGALDKIIFNSGLANPTYLEGVMFYDDTKKAVSYYNDQPEVTVNLGQEVLIRVYNNSGSLISNGQIVYPTGTIGDVPTIDLADASEKSKCRLVAMATQDIPDSTYGFVTRLGSVGGLNTSALSAGWIYLSDIVPGAWTQIRPIDGSYEIIIGEVGAIHASEGTIVVDPVISQLTVEVTDTNGFPLDQKAATTISFVDGTRTFTIAPTGSEFHYYQTGDKFRHTTGQSVVITNVTGLHIIFFDELVLTAIALPTAAQVEDIVLNKCWVSFVYWNATDAKAIIVNDERHGISMSPAVHIYLHRTRGAQYLEGITPTGYVLGDGSSDTHAQFGFTTGTITDEDNETTLSAVASTTGLRYLYKTGASGIWTYGSNAGYSFPVGGTPLPQFNEFTGGAWQLTEVTSGNFMLLHIFASADITLKPLCVLGTAQYNSAALATVGAPNEISVILAGLPAPEFVPIATFILECKTSLTNSVNARIVQTSEGEDYINWITQQIGTGSTPANHNNLAGLELAAAGVTWGHVDSILLSTLFKDRGSYDASISKYPTTGGSGTAGAILKNDRFRVDIAGNDLIIGQEVWALVDSPGQTESNWAVSVVGGSIINYYDATVGSTGDYTTITAAIAAGKYFLKQSGTITEAGAIGTGTYDVTVVGNNSDLITLGAGLGSRIRFYNCNVSITGSGVNGRYTFDRCLVTMNGGFCTNNVKFINGCEITHVSGLGIYNANVSDSTIALNGNSAYMGYISNCIINYTSGNGFIYNGRFSNCYSSATLTFLQCRISQSEFLNSAFNASSANASLTGESIINNVTINASDVNISDSKINGTVTFSTTTGSNSKLRGCVVTGLVTLQASAQANIITNNHLNGGLTDSSGSGTNIIKDNI